jgi:fructokinase
LERSLRIVGLGEVLWDVFPDGEAFGGAPANFACHCRQLGAKASIVSCVGDDERGRRALEFLAGHGVDTQGVATLPGVQTGVVLVTLDAQAKPSYEICEGVAWDRLTWNDTLGAIAAQADAVCFGSLGQRSAEARAVIQRFVAATPPQALRVFDINLRQHYHSPAVIEASLEAANVLKINDEELPVVAAQFGLKGDARQQLQTLLERFALRLAVLTCGADGALMLTPEGSSFYKPRAVDVVSTVGAGDSFTAAVVMGMLHGKPLDEINRHANAVAAYVCCQRGAVPPLLPEYMMVHKRLRLISARRS